MVVPRNVSRERFTSDGRIELLEQDADAVDRNLEAFKKEIRGEVRAIKNLLWGVLVSATTASIVGALNLLFMRGAG